MIRAGLWGLIDDLSMTAVVIFLLIWPGHKRHSRWLREGVPGWDYVGVGRLSNEGTELGPPSWRQAGRLPRTPVSPLQST